MLFPQNVEKQLLKEEQRLRIERQSRSERAGPWGITTLHRLFRRKGKGTVLNTHSVLDTYRHKMFII